MLSVEEALERVLAAVPVLGVESIPLPLGLGRVLAEPVVAARDVPPWDNSSMDGYALRAADTVGARAARPVPLVVAGEVAAGAIAPRPLAAGEAYRIFTGAPMPAGSDAVVPQEDVRREGDRIWVARAVERGACVRPRGEDIQQGERILEPGAVLRPAALGVLASLGRASVRVYQRPRVAVLSTGDELVEPEVPPGPGQIPNTNTYTLAGLVSEAGGVPVSLGIARDDRKEIEERIRWGLGADVLVSSAGVSVGDRDLVRDVVEGLGAVLDFWQVNLRPGKPLTFGEVQGRPFFGLPGNPVSCMVTFELFVRPALRRMGGHRTLVRPRLAARALERLDNPGSRWGYLRVRLESAGEGLGVRPTGEQGSGILRSMLLADALAVLPPDARVSPGESVDIILLGSGLDLMGGSPGVSPVAT
jgi:molybdopterin molybdotransferase